MEGEEYSEEEKKLLNNIDKTIAKLYLDPDTSLAKIIAYLKNEIQNPYPLDLICEEEQYTVIKARTEGITRVENAIENLNALNHVLRDNLDIQNISDIPNITDVEQILDNCNSCFGTNEKTIRARLPEIIKVYTRTQNGLEANNAIYICVHQSDVSYFSLLKDEVKSKLISDPNQRGVLLNYHGHCRRRPPDIPNAFTVREIIGLCDAFFEQDDLKRAGTIIHEASHKYGGTRHNPPLNDAYRFALFAINRCEEA